jgi:EmrB/QacA subfamily drug resistance transporter
MSKPAGHTGALVVITLASFLAPFAASSINIALPSIADELNLDAVTLGWVATAYLLATAVALLPAGRLADIYGRKRLFLLGNIIFGVSSLLIALAPSGAALIAWRIVQGTGAAMLSATTVAILTSIYPASEKGRVLGFNTAAVYTGLSIGPVAGGILTSQFGWRSIFIVNVLLAGAVVAGALWKLQGEWAEARGEGFDIGGAVIYGASLVAIIYGFSQLPGGAGMALVIGGILGLGLFATLEGRVRSPIINLKVFRNNTVLVFSNIAALINYSATSATGFLMSLYLQQIRGYPAETAGLILIAQPVIMAVFSPLAGRLSDSIEPRLLASAGMTLTAIGLFMFAFLSMTTSMVLVIGVLMLLGLGFALFSSPNTNAVMSAVEKRFYGVASATLGTMRVVGQTLSIGIATLIFALFIGHVAISPQNYPELMASIRVAFAIFGGLCVLGIFASLSRGNMHDG